MLFNKHKKEEEERLKELERQRLQKEEERKQKLKQEEEAAKRLEAEKERAKPNPYKFHEPDPKPKELLSVLGSMLKKLFPETKKAYLTVMSYEDKSGYLLICDIAPKFLKIIKLYLDGETKMVRNGMPIDCILYSKSGSITDSMKPFYVKAEFEHGSSSKAISEKIKAELSSNAADGTTDDAPIFDELPEFDFDSVKSQPNGFDLKQIEEEKEELINEIEEMNVESDAEIQKAEEESEIEAETEEEIASEFESDETETTEAQIPYDEENENTEESDAQNEADPAKDNAETDSDKAVEPDKNDKDEKGEKGEKGEDVLPYGILRTFDMNYNDENTKFMTMQTESYYNGEKQIYSGAQMTQYPIYLYKMTVRGTVGGKSYTVSDGQNNVNLSNLPGTLSNYQGLGLSNVSGLTNAVNIAFITDTVANAQTDAASLDTRAYADISVNGYTTATDEKGNEIASSITYSVTPHLSVTDADGAEISSYEITDESLNGAELKVSLHTVGIEPRQVIHYKKDGKKEIFYPEYSEPAINGAKTFEYESDGRGGGFVTIRITDFSDIKILSVAEPETDYAIRYDGKTLAIDCKTGGAYTIVFASYDTSGKMTIVKTLTTEFNAGVNSDVKIPEDVTLKAGDKILLWENLKTLRPLCKAYTLNK